MAAGLPPIQCGIGERHLLERQEVSYVDSGRKTLTGRALPTFLTAAATVLFLSLSELPRSAIAKDLKMPTKLVGLSGQIGTYEEVQRNLEHLEWQEVRPNKTRATASLKDLYDGQMAWRDKIENIEVSFAYSLERRRDSARVLAQKRQNRQVPDNYCFEAEIAMKGEKRFTHIRDATPPPVNSKIKQASPPRGDWVYAFNGAEMKTFEPLRSTGQIHPGKRDAVDSRHVWYFDSLSWPTGSLAARQRQSAWYLPVALSMSSVYRVLPTLQMVDGFPCHVVTSGPDTFWIDVDHGFCLRRRVWFQMSNLKTTPVLASIYINKDVQEDATQVWLPHLCYRIDFAGTQEPVNTQGMLNEVNKVVVRAIDVNTVRDDVFEITYPGGTNVQDLVAKKSYIVPHGEHLLDEAIARANPIINGEVQPYRAGGGPHAIWPQLLILNATALVIVVGGFWWRRRRT
jgi:hypothetical protein